MSTSLAIHQRSLALPEACLFAPSELSIPSSISKEDFKKLGTALVAIDTADSLWQCDFSAFAIKRWGVETGLTLAADATKLSKAFLKRCSVIAERFPPQKRFVGLTREHYRGLCCFPVEFTDAFLPTVAEKGFGAKTLRALCVEAYGSDPKGGYSKNKKRSFGIPETLYARLKERAPIPKVAVFIEQILEDWANNATPEQQARVAAALLTREETQHQRHLAERNAKKAKKREAAEKLRAKREAEKLAQKAERDAFYEAERVEREAERAAAVAAKAKKKAAAHCAKIAKYTASLGKPSQWVTQAEADEVATRFSEGKSYSLESYACDCGQFHIRRAVGACPSDGKPSDDTSPSSQTSAQPRPSYEERRKQQIAQGAEPIRK